MRSFRILAGFHLQEGPGEEGGGEGHFVSL